MNREEFRKYTENEIIILDGATGSFFVAAGMPQRVCVEEWILEHPQLLEQLQKDYIQAGSNIIYAPTFGANRIRLASLNKEGDIKRLNSEPVKLSKSIAGKGALVAADISMTGMFLDPDDEIGFDKLVDVYTEQAQITAEAGADLFIVETMLSLKDTVAAVKGIRKAAPDLACMTTLTFEKNGRTIYGDKPEDVARVLYEEGADAVGANCSTGPADMLPIIEKMVESVKIPVIAKPNAGLPQPGPNGTVKYDLSEDGFAVDMVKMLEAGANILGGCCGTTPEYIRMLASFTHQMMFRSRE